jgi:hypothetical protein
MGCSQDCVQVFPQLASTPCNAGASWPLERLQALGGGRLNDPSQFGKPHQTTVGRKILDRRAGRPLVQRIHEIQSGVSSTPIERISTSSHSSPCPFLAA